MERLWKRRAVAPLCLSGAVCLDHRVRTSFSVESDDEQLRMCTEAAKYNRGRRGSRHRSSRPPFLQQPR